MTAPLDVKKLREVAEKATPGPWERFDNGYWSVIGQSTFSVVSASKDSDGERELITREKGSYENATFIATFNPETVLKLIERLERYRAALKFYADKNNWNRDADGWRHDMIHEDLDDESLKDWNGRFSGKKAREALRADAEEDKP